MCGQVRARNGTPLCSVPNMYMYTMYTMYTDLISCSMTKQLLVTLHSTFLMQKHTYTLVIHIHTLTCTYRCMHIVWSTGGCMPFMITFVLQNGWSPLMRASEKGHVEVVKSLIEAGANINHTNKVGTQILLHSIRSTPSIAYCYSSLS